MNELKDFAKVKKMPAYNMMWTPGSSSAFYQPLINCAVHKIELSSGPNPWPTTDTDEWFSRLKMLAH